VVDEQAAVAGKEQGDFGHGRHRQGGLHRRKRRSRQRR
jgi:hypothetical protein